MCTLTGKLIVTLIFFQYKFPAVTVCNQNRVDCIRLKELLKACEGSDATQCEFVAQPYMNNSQEDAVDMARRISTAFCSISEEGDSMDNGSGASGSSGSSGSVDNRNGTAPDSGDEEGPGMEGTSGGDPTDQGTNNRTMGAEDVGGERPPTSRRKRSDKLADENGRRDTAQPILVSLETHQRIRH